MKRRDWLKVAALGALAPALPATLMRAAADGPRNDRSWAGILNVCAWPKLERLADGTIVAIIFNQPCHGLWEGDLECWASADDGRTWKFRSRVTDHAPRTNRMNCTLGRTKNGDLLVFGSGWDNRNPVGGKPTPASDGKQIRGQIFRSADGGRTWVLQGLLPEPTPVGLGKNTQFMAFGQIQSGANGTLGAAVYLSPTAIPRETYFIRSADDGKTWTVVSQISPTGSETALLHYGDGKWLAAVREYVKPTAEVQLVLFESNDNGQTWTRGQEASLPGQIPGHLLRLQDGQTLLTYGNRNFGNCGVDARISPDNGKSWGPPFRVASYTGWDSGYPSCVQLPDGTVITAYYTSTDRVMYQMGVARWHPSELPPVRSMTPKQA